MHCHCRTRYIPVSWTLMVLCGIDCYWSRWGWWFHSSWPKWTLSLLRYSLHYLPSSSSPFRKLWRDFDVENPYQHSALQRPHVDEAIQESGRYHTGNFKILCSFLSRILFRFFKYLVIINHWKFHRLLFLVVFILWFVLLSISTSTTRFWTSRTTVGMNGSPKVGDGRDKRGKN